MRRLKRPRQRFYPNAMDELLLSLSERLQQDPGAQQYCIDLLSLWQQWINTSLADELCHTPSYLTATYPRPSPWFILFVMQDALNYSLVELSSKMASTQTQSALTDLAHDCNKLKCLANKAKEQYNNHQCIEKLILTNTLAILTQLQQPLSSDQSHPGALLTAIDLIQAASSKTQPNADQRCSLSLCLPI